MFAKLISKLFNIKVETGYGLSTDNDVSLKEPPKSLINGNPIGKFSAQYEFNDEAGLFELIGHRRTPTGKSNVTLRNNKTGDTFSLPFHIFTLMFKRKSL